MNVKIEIVSQSMRANLSYNLSADIQSATQGYAQAAIDAADRAEQAAISAQGIPAPSSPSSGDFLMYNGTTWIAQSLSTWQGGYY